MVSGGMAKVELKKDQASEAKSCSDRFCSCLKRKPDTRHRKITLATGKVDPPNRVQNSIKNQKYNLITFVPVVFYNQFKFFFNLFFLITALSQVYPPLVVGNTLHCISVYLFNALILRILVHVFWTAWDDPGAYNDKRSI